MITVKVSAAHENMDLSMSQKRNFGEIDVCSTDCLVKNIGGAQLILDTRLIPEARLELAKVPTQEEEGYKTQSINKYTLTTANTETDTTIGTTQTDSTGAYVKLQ